MPSTMNAEIRASWESSIRLSSCNAAASSLCIPESDEPSNEPAMPGNMAQSRQNPAVSISAATAGFRIRSPAYSPFSILSRTWNPSIGSVNWGMINAIDTVLDLL